MKKLLIWVLIALLLPPFLCTAQSEARDLTSQVIIRAASKQHHVPRLTDRKYDTIWQSEKGGGTLTLTSPEPMYGLYISWRQHPRPFTIAQLVGDVWKETSYAESEIVHQYYPLEGALEVRISPQVDSGKRFGIQELFVLGDGPLPQWVQRWQPTHEQADLMLLFAHPDDEVLFFGGTLPYYAAERKLKVLPVVFTYANPQRRSELLNSLWSVGIRHYPVLGEFPDKYSNSLQKAYGHYGRDNSLRFLVELLRRHRPTVLVTHDVKGEYGHGVHRLCADIARKGVTVAADPEYHPDSYQQHGLHQVQKLYLHLYMQSDKDVQMQMDWDQPIAALSGLTGFEAAQMAYASAHLSQHQYEHFQVEPRNSRYSSYLFGLAHSEVGPDTLKNDFFENLPQALTN